MEFIQIPKAPAKTLYVHEQPSIKPDKAAATLRELDFSEAALDRMVIEWMECARAAREQLMPIARRVR